MGNEGVPCPMLGVCCRRAPLLEFDEDVTVGVVSRGSILTSLSSALRKAADSKASADDDDALNLDVFLQLKHKRRKELSVCHLHLG